MSENRLHLGNTDFFAQLVLEIEIGGGNISSTEATISFMNMVMLILVEFPRIKFMQSRMDANRSSQVHNPSDAVSLQLLVEAKASLE